MVHDRISIDVDSIEAAEERKFVQLLSRKSLYLALRLRAIPAASLVLSLQSRSQPGSKIPALHLEGHHNQDDGASRGTGGGGAELTVTLAEQRCPFFSAPHLLHR